MSAKRKTVWHTTPWNLPLEAYDALRACGWNYVWDGTGEYDRVLPDARHSPIMSFAGWCQRRSVKR